MCIGGTRMMATVHAAYVVCIAVMVSRARCVSTIYAKIVGQFFVDSGRNASISHIRVYHVGEIDHRGPARQGHDLAT